MPTLGIGTLLGIGGVYLSWKTTDDGSLSVKSTAGAD
jgi:hypothetical protein